MALCPIQRTVQILTRFWLVQPVLVFGNDQGGTDEPYTRLLFFHKNLPSRELFAKRNLSI